jgi:Fe-S oxidoreductase
VALFGGCAVDFIYPKQGEALVDLLDGHNVTLDFPMEQTCCGLPAMMAAEEATAAELADQNVRAFAGADYDHIITLCASCASHIKHNYAKIPATAKEARDRMAAFSDKIIDFSTFMENVLNVSSRSFIKTDQKVAYHAPCHLCRGLKVVAEPRRLIAKSGATYIASRDEEVCCGFGGSYSVDFPEISAEILGKKMDLVERSGADVLVTDCPGCVMQLKGGLDKRGSSIQVKHLAELLANQKKKVQ